MALSNNLLIKVNNTIGKSGRSHYYFGIIEQSLAKMKHDYYWGIMEQSLAKGDHGINRFCLGNFQFGCLKLPSMGNLAHSLMA